MSDVDEASGAIAKRGSRRSPGTTRMPKSRHKQRLYEQRARWVLREWERNPAISYSEMISSIQERFAVGITASEVSYSRALEMLQESASTWTADRLIHEYSRVYAEALIQDKHNAAVRALTGIANARGLNAPTQVDVNTTGMSLEKLAHFNIFSMTPTQRANRERELVRMADHRALSAAKVANADESFPDTGSIIDQELDSLVDVDDDDER